MAKKELKFNFSSSKKTKTNIDEDQSESQKLKKMTAGLPDPGTSRLERFKKRPRVTLNFKIPDLLKEDFEAKAIELGYTRKFRGKKFADLTAMLYHCMREAGIDVPDEQHIDGRRS